MPEQSVLTPESPDYPIQPRHINTGNHFFEAFGHMETEISARWIVRFCQPRGNWSPFTFGDLEAFYREGGYRGFWLNRLGNPEYLTITGPRDERGCITDATVIAVTDAFIQRCFKASPAESEAANA